MPTPDKDIQNNEASQGSPQQEQADREMSVEALNVTGDDAGDSGDVVAANTDFTPEPAPKPFNRNSVRDEITKNFRSGRAKEIQEAQEDIDDIRAMSNNGLPREFQDQVGDDDVTAINDAVNDSQRRVETQPELDPEPRRLKLKINGVERELTQDEVIAAAQKTLAGDDYLGKAKETARALIDEVKQGLQGLRPAATTQNQGDVETEQTGAEDTTNAGDENHVDPVIGVIEKLQFGDPAEAAKELKALIADAGRTASQQEIIKQRRQMEFTRSMSQLRNFQGANPDLAGDAKTEAAIRAEIFSLQREDLINAGLPEKDLPTNPEAMANVHLDVRSLGGNVRTVPQILEKAKANFVEWRGGKPPSREAPGQQQQQQNSEPARPVKAAVEVNVDRTNRRKEITQQPTRTMSPRPDARPEARRDGTSVVQRMQQVRQAPRQGRATSLPA